jgi:hypothetical protein
MIGHLVGIGRTDVWFWRSVTLQSGLGILSASAFDNFDNGCRAMAEFGMDGFIKIEGGKV